MTARPVIPGAVYRVKTSSNTLTVLARNPVEAIIRVMRLVADLEFKA